MTTAQWRTVTLVLGGIFLVLVAILVVLVLSRSGDRGVGSTSTPSATASASSSAGGGTGSPEASLEASASPAVGGSPSASTSPAATGTATPARAIIKGLGVDDPGSPQARPRIVVFTSDGGGDVTVRLQNATGGRVEFCLYPGTLAKPIGDPACLKSTGSTLTGHAKSKKPFTWTVTLIGAKAGTTPMTDLRIDWPASQPRLEIVDLRLQGKGSKPYNGVVVDLGTRPGAGTLHVAATWSDPVGGDSHPYKAVITDRDTGATLESAEGDSTGAELSTDLKAKQRAEVSLTNPGPIVATEVLAALSLTWP
ncbi:MAG TPA: hypothetical protein VIF44_02625 [Candidatus Limnocylindrales bacterium]